MIEIDGSQGEGGGQILRTALSLACVTGRGVRITRIRAGRRRPGLAPQHLATLRALASLCGADVRGDELRSTEVELGSGAVARPGSHDFDVSRDAARGSAGSVCLMAHALLPVLAGAPGPTRVTLRGGTHVPWSPPFDHLVRVFLPAIGRMGINAQARLLGHGFYPAGGGSVELTVAPRGGPPDPIEIVRRGPVRRVRGLAVASRLPRHVPERMAGESLRLLAGAGLDADVEPLLVESPGPGGALVLVAESEETAAGFSAVCRRGVPAAEVAAEACRSLVAHARGEAPIETHLADQLLVPMALAAGRSRFLTCRVSRHLLSAAHVIRAILGARVSIAGVEGAPGEVIVDGVG